MDGYGDLAIGAYGMGSFAGKVYIVHGASSSAFTRDMPLSNQPSYTGEVANDYAGYSVASAGDVNRDGYADLLIGAFGNSQKASQAGKAYVILGHSGTWSRNAPLAQVSYYFLGSAAKDFAGYSVAGAGDLNRDAFADLLIGAPGRDQNGSDSGMVGLMYGRSGTGGAYELNQVNATFQGEKAGDNAGARVSSAGDVDGDGYADFIVSGHLSDRASQDAGAAYLFRGGSSKKSGTLALSNAATVFTGETALDNAGWFLSSAGDMDDDGFGDLLVSAWGNDYNGAGAGMTYVVLTGTILDIDGDGYSEAMGDCDDSDAFQNPGVPEIPMNGVDDDCRGGDAKMRPRVLRQ